MATRKNSTKSNIQKLLMMPSEENIIAMTFDMIAEKGLGKMRISDLAQKIKLPLDEVYRHYPTVDAIIAKFIDQIDREMIKNVPFSAHTSKRDIYFDMMMSRLDTMQVYRTGMARWLQDVVKQPTLWADTLKRWDQSLSLMLDIAKDSPLFPVKKLGLAAIYAATLRAWVKDDSPDMAKTMATLDQALGRAEEFSTKYLVRKKAA